MPPRKNHPFLRRRAHMQPAAPPRESKLSGSPRSLGVSPKFRVRWLRAPPLCPDKDSRFQGEVGCLLGALKFGGYPDISSYIQMTVREARFDVGYYPETWFFTSIKQHTTYAVFLVHGKILVKFMGVLLPGTTQYQRDYSYWRWGRTSGLRLGKGQLEKLKPAAVG